MEKNKDLIKRDFDNYLKKEKENYLNLIKLLNKFASRTLNTNIIFRPHPRQKIRSCKKRFNNKIKTLK